MAGGSELGQVLHANNGHREGSSPLPASRRFSPGKGRAALLQIPRIRAEVLRVGQVARPLRVDAKRPEPRQQEVVERSDKRHVGPAEGEGHPRYPDDGVDDGDAEEGFSQAACVAVVSAKVCCLLFIQVILVEGTCTYLSVQRKGISGGSRWFA